MLKKLMVCSMAVAMVFILFSCGEDSTEPKNLNSDIPANPQNIQVPATVFNNIIPSATFEKTAGNENRIKVNLLGLVNPNTLQPLELSADYTSSDYNTFLTEDDILKGIKLTKVGSGTVLKTDIVFVVDNSGSMDQEADSVAASIIDFANFLSNSGLDAVFGCVGYYGNVNGAINLTDVSNLSNYLNRSYGTYRTYGFSGPDSAMLETAAYGYASGVYNENGVVGILFADSLFAWRVGSQRVFINFTDEPTQPSNLYDWSTAYLCSYMLGRATVHTVFSEDTTYYSSYWQDLVNERPWKMSECTGGTVKFVDSYASNLDLTNLPVSGALANSYLLEFVTSSPADSHTVIITIKESDADGKIVYKGIIY